MSRRQIAFLTTMVLVLCAGVVVGRLTTRIPVPAPEQGPRPSWIAQQLDLSTDQRQQMDAIWADTRQKMDQSSEKRHDLDKQRDAEVQALLSDQQRAAFEKIMTAYHSQRAEMDKQRESLIHDAETRSRALLDPTQQKKWDELSKEMHNHHGPHRPGGSPQTNPATQPG
jgi:Spy/CpxP family protein refolding chaperone